MIEMYVYVQAEKNFKEHIDCKTAGFFLKMSKDIGKEWRKSLSRKCGLLQSKEHNKNTQTKTTSYTPYSQMADTREKTGA